MSEKERQPVCPVCGKPVAPDEAVLREDGTVVHARCWKPPVDDGDRRQQTYVGDEPTSLLA